MDLKTIKNLLNLISDSDVNEVEIEEGDFKIKIKKQADTVYKGGGQPVYMGPPQGMEYNVPPVSPTSPAGEQPDQTKAEPAPGKKEDDQLITVRSPIVGTYYGSPSPESEPYLNIGDTVSKGDVLCIIEAMKIMNEVESEYSGKIVKILVDNAQPVEFDQPLFLIEPS